jgi:hypothetical protein
MPTLGGTASIMKTAPSPSKNKVPVQRASLTDIGKQLQHLVSDEALVGVRRAVAEHKRSSAGSGTTQVKSHDSKETR